MAIESDSLSEVLLLAQACEDLARAALGVAQNQLRMKVITQAAFDQAFQDYGIAMQKARDLYYQASHGLTQQIIHASDLKVLADQTKDLKKSLSTLQHAEHILSISFGVVVLIGALATAVTEPGSATLQGAYTAARTFQQIVTG